MCIVNPNDMRKSIAICVNFRGSWTQDPRMSISSWYTIRRIPWGFILKSRTGFKSLVSTRGVTISPNARALNWYVLSLQRKGRKFSHCGFIATVMYSSFRWSFVSLKSPCLWRRYIDDKFSVWKCLFITKSFNEHKSIIGLIEPYFFRMRKRSNCRHCAREQQSQEPQGNRFL